MSSISQHNSPTKTDDGRLLSQGEDTPKVTRGAVAFDNPRFCMNILSSFDDGNEIKDVDGTSSSSSSGIVSSSTVGKDYLDDDSIILGNTDCSNVNRKLENSQVDCLAYRRPWATPPTAPSESSKLQLGGFAIYIKSENVTVHFYDEKDHEKACNYCMYNISIGTSDGFQIIYD